jgi:ubiquinone/menaquinone biosynthesis C-methylase UbiE
LWPEPAKILSAVGFTTGMTVTDLCCGDGRFTLSVAKVARCVVALDIDRKLLALARVRLTEKRHHQL